MCLGIPGKIIALDEHSQTGATIDVCGVSRKVDISCLLAPEILPEQLVGQWVLVHVGFAMAVIDEQQAQETLQALQSMQALEHEIADFSQLDNHKRK
ncbi:HypC/HybG/HupF family hydrogenase formation chaperone [Photobacterium lipolyticum]|uniref:HypC/HybG/HupF family hydrogenase formation chaperone n=1 Tax=Photobacterium lipolyticum TaxID=266810 RepID=A0A2T3MW72_9GAMM|nr:HypC/HybG/HupF family hydrogenase formation chaperone [Photobacterium lipolyticum]PSW04207.1 HypC/HybG/HupF family hydrogenase formation chaperone [Photobacterium lipolyticum]